MKDYFLSLFEYNLYTNNKISEAIIAANSPQKALDLMGHLLTAEQVWVRRLKGEYKVEVVLWPKWTADKFADIIESNYQLWKEYLATAAEADIDGPITYRNFQDKEFTMRVRDIITHVINHGTHTRAQIGVHLKLAGVETLPVTDFSYYKTSV
ncbi:MAG: DinB family protein [Bacteroidota bacterium]